MSYFRYIDNGRGPTKLFIGGVHGNEGVTSLKFLKRIDIDDLSPGQFYFYNFDRTEYISENNFPHPFTSESDRGGRQDPNDRRGGVVRT